MGLALIDKDGETIHFPSNEEVIEEITPKPTQIHRRKRNFTDQDFYDIARMMAVDRMSETEACERLNIVPESWWRFKQKKKNDVRFAALIARLRGDTVDKLMRCIDRAALGIGMKQPDWRAAAWKAGVIDRERYGDQKVIGSQTIVNNTINNNLFVEAAKRIYGEDAKVVSDGPMKQIREAPK